MSTIYLANDKYRAQLTASYTADPADSYLAVSSVPTNVPTIVVVGWKTDFETVFSVEGKSGSSVNDYTLTGVTRLRGYNDDIPINTTVNCLNNEEFLNQYSTYLGINWKGEWDSGTAYVVNDGVSYNGTSYVALQASTNQTPTETSYWQVVGVKGDTGATGATGEGVPAGGSTNEVLKKASNTDYDTVWSEVSGMPTGAVTSFAGSTAPSGYLLCNGSAVSRTTYADLFAVIGETYGAGDGSTTFNLPDLQGKVITGLDGGDTDFDSLGETGGAKTNTHNHYTNVSHDGSNLYVTQSGDTPRSRVVTKTRSNQALGAASGATRQDSTYNEVISIVQPYLTLNYIIKT